MNHLVKLLVTHHRYTVFILVAHQLARIGGGMYMIAASSFWQSITISHATYSGNAILGGVGSMIYLCHWVYVRWWIPSASAAALYIAGVSHPMGNTPDHDYKYHPVIMVNTTIYGNACELQSYFSVAQSGPVIVRGAVCITAAHIIITSCSFESNTVLVFNIDADVHVEAASLWVGMAWSNSERAESQNGPPTRLIIADTQFLQSRMWVTSAQETEVFGVAITMVRHHALASFAPRPLHMYMYHEQ